MTKREIDRRKAKLDKQMVALAVHALNLRSEMEVFVRDLQIAHFQQTSKGKPQ